MTMQTNQSIEHFLDAIGQVHGADYKDKTFVTFCGGHYYKVKYPHQEEGTIVPLVDLNLMTRDLLDHPDLHRARREAHHH